MNHLQENLIIRISSNIRQMAQKLKYRCETCGYEAEVYEGRGLFRQQITPMSCPDCKTIQNIVVGGIIADVAPSYRSEVGRLCLQCGSDSIRMWDKHTCPKCQGEMEETGEKEFWTQRLLSYSYYHGRSVYKWFYFLLKDVSLYNPVVWFVGFLIPSVSFHVLPIGYHWHI